MTSVNVAGQKISNTDYVPLTNVRLSNSKGWAIKEQKAVVRIPTGVNEFLTNIFNKRAKDLDQKSMSGDLVRRIKKTSFRVGSGTDCEKILFSAGFATKGISS